MNSTFGYDGDGNRISQTNGTGAYSYLNDVAIALPVVLNEQGPDGNITYAYGLGLVEEYSSTFNNFYHYDGLGSVIGLTNAKGTLQAAYVYDPWGNALLSATDLVGSKNKFRFTGEALDPGTGLYFLRARYYDTTISRFESRDPIYGFVNHPQSLNRFQYALNNPVRFYDPAGLSAIEAQAAGQTTSTNLPYVASYSNVGATPTAAGLTNSGSTIPVAPAQQPSSQSQTATHPCFVEVTTPGLSNLLEDAVQIFQVIQGIISGDVIDSVHPFGPLPSGSSGGYLIPATCGTA
jgi:RHS repeat-associated protein